jgi:molybdopterin synthase sulfur carrier subunit
MQVQVKLFSTLAVYNPAVAAGVPFSLELEEGSVLEDLFKQLKLPNKEVKLAFVNGRLQTVAFQLKNQDEVGIFPPIGGG